jgi:hypothetical protein
LPWFEKKKEQPKEKPNTPDEEKLVHLITTNQTNAEAVRGVNEGQGYLDESGIEQVWEDESKMLIGDQWSTSIAYRTKKARKIRPNTVDNFIFPAVTNILANICASDPEVTIEGTEDSDKEVAEKLTFLSRFNDKRNKFPATWKKMVQQFIAYGPVIGSVEWDSDWIGGTGPNRWVGDVRISNIDRRNIYFDPAIIDLEERLQECGFIHEKYRKKLEYIQDRWPERGKHVTEDTNDNELQDEGQDPKQVWLIKARHRGLPKYMPEERKKALLKKANDAELRVFSELPPDPFKAQEYRDMAAGKLKGVHVAYVANGVLLEYFPYEYEDGLYPYAYKVCYFDENSPHGFGEIRNTKVPQILHNKADEIEIEAMSLEGLGGMYYNVGAVTKKQLDVILAGNAKGGVWNEVTNINMLKPREGAKTPPSINNYKEHKQRMVETISQNTPIQQGMAPSANMPYKAIAELGARTDVRTKLKVQILEDFLTELNKLRINRFMEFYEEDRYYRLKGPDNKPVEDTFKADEAKRVWDRQILDDEGNVTDVKQEIFVPEFDITIKIMDEKPTDRNYYTQTAVSLFGSQAMDLESLWYTLEEGKFPQAKEILERLQSQNDGLAMAQMLSQVPPELKNQFMQMQQQLMQQMLQGGAPPPEQQQGIVDSLPDEVLMMLRQMPPEQQEQQLQMMAQMQPEELNAYIGQMMGGE